ncbi:MAG: ArsJ-associated glyceraldehyde-3-phosphate dehydrogenase [Candidatus Thiodiazotropha lotti]|uniref:Glyceraldehyde-3-phosphate dehydrogenase n=1 Tax=Candidatus Thiodiazotropha lotti TaxID=2792787 RepID=A0A9E4K8T9_9GAMM|nr:ArsJ-associated glyceraldehyde-3-phosphate dehydrogenase [Candidatus Thiodiazotropha lotti]MCG7921446.1 ArsJ-associated glyceraldehyde-3-phosphate dehydrogenase [Candidatus Thiodiazotropha lotti]MCG7931684.1 ArsJ-associated glyceraldehyde-3-phosphate dehydrogenase [Candidatus Thiodiazotropha lotti]MCG7941395.1 ArsJ-associated glyceraldehyde-3-phosphate dehydrogenase [Candidatus Thiodiazotropha lotti]MCG7985764.1 ArsJ-associated glyceraldehyde-3-phosphate dehydrogenase [Candidatus Thiodiazotr
MKARIGINGFGRMGRLGLRAGWNDANLAFCQINEIAGDAGCSAHLLQFDSVHGVWDRQCQGEGSALRVDESSLSYSSNPTIDETDWSGCDIVIEATGKHHKKPERLQSYFDQGVKKVVVAAPTEGALNLVYGVNDHLYDPQVNHLITAASCTTNCLAPLVKVLHEKIGIVHGCMTTIHDITNTQTIVDRGHKDLRRARACGQSLIPTTTGSAKAITKIFPELEGRLDGHAVRVPLLNGSLTDFVFEAPRAVTAEEVNGYLREAAEGELKGILGYEERPLVSVDYVNDPRSSIVDAPSTLVIDDRQVKIYAWYDNEWGYANRLIDIVRKVAAG